jgi:transposase
VAVLERDWHAGSDFWRADRLFCARCGTGCSRPPLQLRACDLEAGKVVDLLPDREAATVAAWLQDHPGTEIVSRDRASAYAEATRRAAPQAVQIADRWHLMRNMSEALRTALEPHHRVLKHFASAYDLADPEGTALGKAYLEELYRASPEIAALAHPGREFFRLVRGRDLAVWPQWRERAKHTALRGFASSLLRDQHAVEAALTLPWSNGPVEGHVHRLKLIKRQMYGRASFDLLRLRVLHQA